MFCHPRRLSADKHDTTDDYTYTSVLIGYMYCAVNRTGNTSELKTDALVKQMEEAQTLLISII